MEYRTLGKTGLKISRMGFGGIPIQKKMCIRDRKYTGAFLDIVRKNKV